MVLGLPRGGVPVAYQVACALDAPLDVIVVRKLGVPFQPEVAMGAIGEDGVRVLDRDMVARADVSEAEVAEVERREQEVLAARVRRYRRGRDRVDLHGRTAIVVDDGWPPGRRPVRRAASPVCSVRRGSCWPCRSDRPTTLRDLPEADTVVAVEEPADFRAVGFHYVDFSPTSDDEVVVLLDRAARRVLDDDRLAEPVDCDIDVEFDGRRRRAAGSPAPAGPVAAVVVFAHGSGSSRHSPRNRLVADVLYDAGIGTFLLDLLTPTEENDGASCSTSTSWPAGWSAATMWVHGRPEARERGSATSGRAPGPPRRSWLQPTRGARCRRWCRGVVVPTWRWRACPR